VADSDQRYRVLCLFSLYYLWQSEAPSAHELGRQLLELAERDGDPTRLILAHYAVSESAAFSGCTCLTCPLLDLGRPAHPFFDLIPGPALTGKTAPTSHRMGKNG
jgi:hypothetical protein